MSRPHDDRVRELERNDVAAGTGTPPALVLVKSDTGAPAPRHTLASAAREGVVPLGYEALKKARQRPGFPEPGEDGKWSAEELSDWYDRRPSARKAVSGE